jgi:peptidoglycan glycosyltransferase
MACALSLALVLLAMTCGYWAVVRDEELHAREDNPRRVLYERRIQRGRILDRNGNALADIEIANDGTVTRRYPTPEAGPVVGYASLRYGTGGIEAAFDTELRGLPSPKPGEDIKETDPWKAAWQELLHSPPQGQDIQLTLDAELQAQAQRMLEGYEGAAVLLDAASGEILALASSPTFDPARLEEKWENLRQDPTAPLLNRATQGLYQPGSALQTVILIETLDEGLTSLAAPVSNATATLPVDGTSLGCSVPLSRPATLADAYTAACPAPFADLGERLQRSGLEETVERWNLSTSPALSIATEAADWNAQAISTTTALRAEVIGQGQLTVSPLHMALVGGTLANEGKMPIPRLVLRVQGPEGNWEEPAAGTPPTIISPERAEQLLTTWRRYREDVAAHWGVAVAGEGQPPHAWFLGVAPADTPRYVVVILLEHPAEPHQAVEIGSDLLETAITQPILHGSQSQ